MARPTVLPTWATDANYAAGSDPWSGQPTRSTPSGGKQGTGYIPATADAAEEDNWVLGTLCDWMTYLADNYATQFGDGSDGDAFITGTILLGKDTYYDNLTMGTGGTLKTNGYRLFVKGTLTFTGDGSGVISCNGNNASGKTAGTGGSSGTLATGFQGGTGGTHGGSGPNNGIGANSSLGGSGGTPVGGGTGGTTTAPTAASGSYHHMNTYQHGHILGIVGGVSASTLVFGGGGGGGGNADGSLDGGGGGAGGGVMVIAARLVVLSANGAIRANGGNATNDAVTLFEGGGGGGGGAIFFTYIAQTLNGHTLTVTASGGQHGTGSAALGTDGSPGTVLSFNLGA